SWVICPVAAVHPSKGGKAPGKAPTKTAIGPTRFSGVYTKQYNTIEMTDKTNVKGLVNLHNRKRLINPHMPAKIKASVTVTRLVGSGRFFVLSMIASKSFSITWLIATDAPERRKAEMVSITSTNQSMRPRVAKP